MSALCPRCGYAGRVRDVWVQSGRRVTVVLLQCPEPCRNAWTVSAHGLEGIDLVARLRREAQDLGRRLRRLCERVQRWKTRPGTARPLKG